MRNIAREDFGDSIDETLFSHTLDKLNSVVDDVFKNENIEFINELKYNNALFSAFKTHRQQKELLAHVLDKNGEVRSFGAFREAVKPIINNYNVNWLQTEYSTTLLRCENAKVFKEALESDTYDCLQWVESTSVQQREAHKIYYGHIWKKTDPFWANNMPGNLWNCKCSVRETSQTAESEPPKPTIKADKGLEGNPAITKKIFSKKHPYQKGTSRKDTKIIKKFVDKHCRDITTKKFVIQKSYKNGGRLYVHPDVDKSKSDYKDLKTFGNALARKGHKVKLTPSVHHKSAEYQTIYKDLIGTKYERKCPDLSIDDVLYEYESFVKPWKKSKVGNMLNHGLKQSSRIIINNNKGCADRYIRRLSNIQASQKLVNEVWVYEKGDIRLIYKQGD